MKTVFGTHFIKLITCICCASILTACEQAPDDEVVEGGELAAGVILVNNLIDRADWSSSRGRLTVQGKAFNGVSQVDIYDGINPNVRLGSASVASDLSWRYRTYYSLNSDVPCSVTAKVGETEQKKDVNNAPSNCSASYSTPSSSSLNNPPNSIILSPISAMNIFVGDSVNFSGVASDPDGDVNLSYLWNFNGGAPNSTTATPGNIKFGTPGTFYVTFTAMDSLGFSDPSPAQIVLTVRSVASNLAPNASIDSPITSRAINAGDAIFFSGSGTDPEGSALTYLWNFGAAGIQASSAQTPGSVIFSKAGVYPIVFTVFDSAGLSDPTPAVVTVTVSSTNSGNNPPNGVIDTPAANSAFLKNSSINLSASGSDPDGDLNLTYLWDFGGYAPRQSGRNVNLALNQVGTVIVRLLVRDTTMLWDPTPAAIAITIADQNVSSNQAPNGVINSPAGNQSVSVGQSVNFLASGSDPDGDVISYRWDFSTSGIPQSSSSTPGNLIFNKAGTYVITLNTTDTKGLSDPSPATVVITVSELNTAPQSTIVEPAANRTINVGDSLNFVGNAVDAENDTIIYRWDFGASGVPVNTNRSPGSVQFNKAGTYNVSFTAIDGKGLSDATPAMITITVNAVNRAPESTISSPIGNVVINEGAFVTFTGVGSDPDGNIPLTYSWNFNGGAINSTQQNPGSVRFQTSGVYRVKFTVTDSTGMIDPTPAEILVTVQAINSNNQAPDSVITAPINDVTIQKGQSVAFNGAGSDADNNLPLNYLWDFGGVVTNSSHQNHGDVVFNQAGFFTVRFTVTDARGLADPTPAVRHIRVLDNSGNQSPNATILNPPANMIISVGDSVLFAGNATDPENNSPLSYLWNFDGSVPNSLVQNPGSIRFETAGVYLVKLYATDSLGARDATPDVRVITVNGLNASNPPNSEIMQPVGNVTVEVGRSLSFLGRGTDPDGNTPFTYLWNFDGAAPNATVASPDAVTFSSAGIYNISLRVTDATGMSDPTPAVVQVTVTNVLSVNEPPNGAIVSPAMDMAIFAGDSLMFSSAGFDPNGDALTYLWNFGGATPNKFVQNPGVVQFATPGVYRVRLELSDIYGLADPTPDEINVVVHPVATGIAPNALIASPASDVAIYEGDSVNFNGLGLDPDGGAIVSYFWNFDGAVPNSSLQNPGSIKFANAGIYRIKLNVTDAQGLVDSTPDEVVVTVSQFNTPSGNAAPNGIISSPADDMVVTVGDTMNFTSIAVDRDNNLPISYRWNFDGAVPNTTAQNPGSVTFNQVGTFRITLTVTDSAGYSDATPDERIISVQGVQSSNRAPNGTISSPLSERSINIGDSLLFSGSATDPDNNLPLTYIWDFAGALPNKVGATPGVVTFMQDGTYKVQLKVFDSLGLHDPTPASVIIRVGNTTSVNLPPETTISAPTAAQIVNVGDSVSFNGLGVDPEGSSVTYRWNFGGAGIVDSTERSPVVTFKQPGVFTVSLTTTDSFGIYDLTPATVKITVQGVVAQGDAPNGIITSPASGPVYITAGDSLTLDSQVSDPNGDTNLLVIWNFGTYPILNQVGQSTRVRFDQKGVATVSLKVRDSSNLWDQTPALLTVYVQ